MKKTMLTSALLAGAFALGVAGNAWAEGSPIIEDLIYVESQDQTYDTIPLHQTDNKTTNGPFQLLEVNTSNTDSPLMTALAPGDPGYSPRWIAPDGTYFVCPLLGQPPSDM